MNLDPESCPHCGIAWANVTIVSPARRGQTYYLCEACLERGRRSASGIMATSQSFSPRFS